jgi:branched-chain amino acid transport system substrate-binding protein
MYRNTIRAMAGASAALALLMSGAQAADPVRIGVALELSGRYAAYGAHCKDGVDMAGQAWGDTVIGRKLDFVVRDLQSEPQSTVSAFNELANQQQINFIIGPTASPIGSAAIGPWRQRKPIWLVPGVTTTAVEEQVGSENTFFHMFPFSWAYYRGLAGALKQYVGAGKRVAMIYVDDSYGRPASPIAKKFIQEAGLEVVAEEVVRANSPDMNPILTKLSRVKPDVLLALVQTSDAVTLAKQVYTRRYNVPFLVGIAFAQLTEWQQAAGEAQDGWVGVGGYLPHVVEWPADKANPKLFPSTKEWEAAFSAKFKREPTYNDIMCYATTGLLLTAIQNAGTDDLEKVNDALRKIDVMTPYGPGKFVKTPEGTTNQAFDNLLVFQRQKDNTVVVYPPNLANAKLVAVSRGEN